MAKGQTITTPPPLVLVADSEATSRLSLGELLRNEGYRVIETDNSRVAVSHLGPEQDVKIILADLEMPSWTSIIKHARANLPESFILGMVRYGALANARDAEQLGTHGHLVKPLSFTEVNNWIKRCLSGSSEIPR
jgi:DNA-binding NtrC family response regulator